MGDKGYRQRKKTEAVVRVLEHYGGGSPRCAKCGVAISQGDPYCVVATTAGAKELRAQYRNRAGASFYPILVRLGYPAGFEIRCDECMHGPEFQKISPRGRVPQAISGNVGGAED